MTSSVHRLNRYPTLSLNHNPVLATAETGRRGISEWQAEAYKSARSAATALQGSSLAAKAAA